VAQKRLFYFANETGGLSKTKSATKFLTYTPEKSNATHCAKLDTFSINIQRYSKNQAQKLHFWATLCAYQGQYKRFIRKF